jgi:phosphoribosylformylglycinamidine (FGAM) synthase PurS component
MKTLVIEFPDHLQLHAMGADGNVEVKAVKKTEMVLKSESQAETQQPVYSICQQ